MAKQGRRHEFDGGINLTLGVAWVGISFQVLGCGTVVAMDVA
jgi:hypothetical protein